MEVECRKVSRARRREFSFGTRAIWNGGASSEWDYLTGGRWGIGRLLETP
jgi:hypothetical protein